MHGRSCRWNLPLSCGAASLESTACHHGGHSRMARVRHATLRVCAFLAATALSTTVLQRGILTFASLCGPPSADLASSAARSARRPRRSAGVNVASTAAKDGASGQLAVPPALQMQVTVDLVKAQNKAGHTMKELGAQLQAMHFEASALDGQVRVAYNGVQGLRRVDVAQGALQTAGGAAALAQAVLGALQEAHDASYTGTKGDVWSLYQENPPLMQAPLNELGAGSTAEDVWANVTKSEESVRLAEDLFQKFDADQNGYWSFEETSQVQLATEGTEMTEDAFTSLIIAAAPDGGRHLSEEDLQRGLSRAQVIELYTDAQRQRTLGFVLDIFKDHAKVFAPEQTAPEQAASAIDVAGEPESSRVTPVVD